LKVKVEVPAHIIGEHGEGQVPVLSSARIAGMPIQDLSLDQGPPSDEAALSAIANETRMAGLEIGVSDDGAEQAEPDEARLTPSFVLDIPERACWTLY
jgi:malate/lactate dehydrogenase